MRARGIVQIGKRRTCPRCTIGTATARGRLGVEPVPCPELIPWMGDQPPSFYPLRPLPRLRRLLRRGRGGIEPVPPRSSGRGRRRPPGELRRRANRGRHCREARECALGRPRRGRARSSPRPHPRSTAHRALRRRPSRGATRRRLRAPRSTAPTPWTSCRQPSGPGTPPPTSSRASRRPSRARCRPRSPSRSARPSSAWLAKTAAEASKSDGAAVWTLDDIPAVYEGIELSDLGPSTEERFQRYGLNSVNWLCESTCANVCAA